MLKGPFCLGLNFRLTMEHLRFLASSQTLLPSLKGVQDCWVQAAMTWWVSQSLLFLLLYTLSLFPYSCYLISLIIPFCLGFSLFFWNALCLNAASLFTHCAWLCITFPFILRDYPFFPWMLFPFLCSHSFFLFLN